MYQLLFIPLTILTMTRATASIFALLFLFGFISATKIPKIIGGRNAAIKDFPYIVSLRDKHGKHSCGGSIISDRHILTAGHCAESVNEDDIDGYSVHSGTSRTDRVGNAHKILSVHIHPTYDSRKEVDGSDDIAVLTLKKPIVFNKHQQKIKLPSHDVQDNQVATLAGWGRTTTSNWDPATQLQKLRLVVLPSEKCIPHLTDSKIDEKQICAIRNTGKAACHFDSGSPLVSHGVIVGVVSRGDTWHCAVGLPDIYTNVYAHKDFIESVMNE